MSERVHEYFEKLKVLSNEALECSAIKVSSAEKQNTAGLIAHITEIKERKYHLTLGCRNIFEYCTKRLNLAEGTIYLRMQVSSVCRKYPQLLESICSGRLHLTGASLIAPHLKDNNVEKLIADAEGKTRRKIEEILVKLAPKKLFKSSCRKQPSRNKSLLSDYTQAGEEKVTSLNEEHRTRNIIEPATEDRYNFRLNTGKGFNEKLKRLAEVLGKENVCSNIEEILEQALDIALDKKDPMRKLERRRKRAERVERKSSSEEKKPEEKPEIKETEKPLETPATTRNIPSEVRERLLEKGGYRCEYVSPDGVRCSSRTGLEVDHIHPYAVNQSNDEENLRILCKCHNRLVAEEYFGRKFIEKKIGKQRQEKVKGSEVEQTVVKT